MEGIVSLNWVMDRIFDNECDRVRGRKLRIQALGVIFTNVC